MKLCKSLFGQGYKLLIDNYCTSAAFLKGLLKNNIAACDTINPNQKGFSVNLKNVKKFNGQRGNIR